MPRTPKILERKLQNIHASKISCHNVNESIQAMSSSFL